MYGGEGGGDEPADAVLLDFPVVARGAVEGRPRVVDVLAQAPRDLPLRVVGLGRRRGDVAAGEDLAGVGEDGAAPPLQLAVGGVGREAADVGTCARQSGGAWVLERGSGAPVAGSYDCTPTGMRAKRP